MISSREQHILRYGSGEIPNQMLTWFVINCEKHGAGRISLVRFLRQIQGWNSPNTPNNTLYLNLEIKYNIYKWPAFTVVSSHYRLQPLCKLLFHVSLNPWRIVSDLEYSACGWSQFALLGGAEVARYLNNATRDRAAKTNIRFHKRFSPKHTVLVTYTLRVGLMVHYFSANDSQ